MTSKDYIAVAAILARTGPRETIARELADLFASDNSRFDRDKFLRASGVSIHTPERRCRLTVEDIPSYYFTKGGGI